MDVRHLLGDPLGERALPSPDLQRDVVGLELGVAHDRIEQVRVGEKILTEPHHLKILSAFASTVRSSSA
jgi:hypothetical protein